MLRGYRGLKIDNIHLQSIDGKIEQMEPDFSIGIICLGPKNLFPNINLQTVIMNNEIKGPCIVFFFSKEKVKTHN